MSRAALYQAAAAKAGTRIVRCSKGIAPSIGGAITYHPLARSTAEQLAIAVRAAGGEARLAGDGDRAYVYLSGCSFDRREDV